MEIGTHPDDLFISVFELKDQHPGKWGLIISRGRGHNYKYLLTSDDPRSWTDSKEEMIEVVRMILVGNSLQALYHSTAPKNVQEFIKEAEKWGYTKEWVAENTQAVATVYAQLQSRGGPVGMLGSMIDPNRSLNLHMINEIVERLKVENPVDTSTKPLKSFSGAPTSPAHRLG